MLIKLEDISLPSQISFSNQSSPENQYKNKILQMTSNINSEYRVVGKQLTTMEIIKEEDSLSESFDMLESDSSTTSFQSFSVSLGT